MSGPALVGYSVVGGRTNSTRSLDLKLTLNPSGMKALGPSNIEIVTDHPEQPTVTLTIVVTPSRTGKPDAAQ